MCKLAFLDTVFIFPRKFPKKSYFICAFIQFERMQEIYRHIISLDTDEFNRTFDTNQKCLDFIIRELYDGEVRSPFCDSQAYPMKEFGRYKCAKTRKTFYITRNTIFLSFTYSLEKVVCNPLSVCNLSRQIYSIFVNARFPGNRQDHEDCHLCGATDFLCLHDAKESQIFKFTG